MTKFDKNEKLKGKKKKKKNQKIFKKKKKKKKRQKKKLTASCPVTNTRTEFSLAPGWTS